jgi:hypothetical protein
MFSLFDWATNRAVPICNHQHPQAGLYRYLPIASYICIHNLLDLLSF